MISGVADICSAGEAKSRTPSRPRRATAYRSGESRAGGLPARGAWFGRTGPPVRKLLETRGARGRASPRLDRPGARPPVTRRPGGRLARSGAGRRVAAAGKTRGGGGTAACERLPRASPRSCALCSSSPTLLRGRVLCRLSDTLPGCSCTGRAWFRQRVPVASMLVWFCIPDFGVCLQAWRW